MKTLNFELALLRPIACLLLCLSLFCAGTQAQNAQEEATEPEPQAAEAAIKVRPEASDPTSQQLIRNYLTVTGGAKAHEKIMNVVATGTLEEAGKIKNFELIELRNGKRHLTLTWRHLGRDYQELLVFDGLLAWKQQVSLEWVDPEDYGGQEAIHFSSQRWLLHPFVLPTKASYVFKYQGGAKVSGRSCHVIVGYGKKDERSWFYFDKEKFLLLRWGGLGQIAGVREYMDYRTTKFKKVDGVILPSEIDLLAENAPFGKIRFNAILTNQEIDLRKFNKPASRTPVLRQRTSPSGL